MGRRCVYLACAVVMLVVAGQAAGQHKVAETLLVDLRAEDLPDGPVTGTWPSRGTLGDFTARGGPIVQEVGGIKAVTFDGFNWFDGPLSVSGIEGNGTRSIEVWVHNPSIASEETLVHWSHRGGPDGTNLSFNYGNHTAYGAVGHWGGPDMGWGGTVAPSPAAGKWWHLVYTYDGTTVRLYANGRAAGQKQAALNTHRGNRIRVAAQGDNSGQGIVASLCFTGSIAQVRIHDGVLTATQIEQNFRLGGPLKAYNPDPADGATSMPYPVLNWEPGVTAATHNVYLGTSPELGPADLVKSNLTTRPYIHFLPTEPGTTYYWRVDGVEADRVTTHIGDVWSFTLASLTAYDPRPADGAHFQDPNVDLAWTGGKNGGTYDIYFGTDYQQVADGTGDTLKAAQLADATFEPGMLSLGTTYYWRVDQVEFDGARQVGKVWSFTTIPDVAVSDPNLVGWWTLDEGEGRVAVDGSGRGNHGGILGGTTWIDGYDGGALQLHGQNGYVSLPIGPVIASLDSTTITAWVDFSNAGGAWQRIYDFGTSSTQGYMFLCPRGGTAGPMRFVITATGNQAGAESIIDAADILPSGWHHVATVINGSTRFMELYVDGVLTASGSVGVIPSELGNTTQNWLGRSQYADAYFRGSLDDVRIYDFAMTAAQIPETMRGNPLLAWSPEPACDSAVDVSMAETLSWSAGSTAVRHDVYFGADAAAVADANTSSPLYRGRQAGTSYSVVGLVEYGGGDYFWRVDEIEADGVTVRKGRVWALTVLDYLIVDDFETYTHFSPDRVFQTWLDGVGFSSDSFFPNGYDGNGTGSAAGHDIWAVGTPYTTIMEPNITHDDSGQSMPFYYGYDGKPTSQVERTFKSPRDWTAYGVTTLVVHFHGVAGNVPAPLYVKINGVNVSYRDGAPATTVPLWQTWNIDLASVGTDLRNVRTLTIGIGAGGSGVLYIDDLRLYRSAPPVVPPMDPGTNGLALLYAMEGNVQDTSGNNRHGTPSGDPLYVQGLPGFGQAMSFDGVNDSVDLPIGTLLSTMTGSTFATWMDITNTGNNWQRMFDFGTGTTNYMFLSPYSGSRSARFAIRTASVLEQLVNAPAPLTTGWHHMAVVIDSENMTLQLYQDGILVASALTALVPKDLGVTTQNWLGRSQFTPDPYLAGSVDDFRIYTRPLSESEIRYLVGDR